VRRRGERQHPRARRRTRRAPSGSTAAGVSGIGAERPAGKIKADHALLERSGLLALEIKLSEDIIPSRQRYVRERVAREIGNIVETNEATVPGAPHRHRESDRRAQGAHGKNLDMNPGQ